jgi:hypothetical protein
MDLIKGINYIINFENGSKIEGNLDKVKYLGGQIYSLWIDIGGQPVYIAFSDVKSIEIGEEPN